MNKLFFRIILNILFAITQIIVPFLPALTGIGKSIEQRTKYTFSPPEMPSGYAFSVWLVIFALSIIYAYYQALPSQKNNKLFEKIGYYTAITFLGSTLWMLIVQIYGDGWIPVIIIIIMLVCVIKSFFITVNNGSLSKFERFITIPLLGLYSGWLTVASFLNLTSVIREKFTVISTFSHTIYGLFTIIPALILGLICLYKSKGNIWYGATLIWALIAIIINNLFVVHNFYIAVISGFSILITIISIRYFRKLKIN